jgi:hypothetical protein
LWPRADVATSLDEALPAADENPTCCKVFGYFFKVDMIYEWRERARSQCLERRKAACKTDLFIEDNLRGKTCGT